MKRIITAIALLIVLPITWIAVSPQVAHGGERVEISVYRTSAGGKSERLGSVAIANTQYGLLLTPNLAGLNPGVHGFHIHQNPDCSAVEKDGTIVPGLAAGGHYDPDQASVHLGPYAEGHLGDLPPLYVAADGTATTPVLAPRLSVSHIWQRSLMIHAGGDNFADQPTPLGGGGARSACGLITH